MSIQPRNLFKRGLTIFKTPKQSASSMATEQNFKKFDGIYPCSGVCNHAE